MREVISCRVHEYYWNQDLSCVITTLKTLSELFSVELDPQVMDAAFGLNAGRLGSQCGLVEGTLMFIGIYGKIKGVGGEAIKVLGYKFSSSFQQHFDSILCRELRPRGFNADDPPHLCENLTKLAINFSAEFIKKEFCMK